MRSPWLVCGCPCRALFLLLQITSPEWENGTVKSSRYMQSLSVWPLSWFSWPFYRRNFVCAHVVIVFGIETRSEECIICVRVTSHYFEQTVNVADAVPLLVQTARTVKCSAAVVLVRFVRFQYSPIHSQCGALHVTTFILFSNLLHIMQECLRVLAKVSI